METPKHPWSGPDNEEFAPAVECEQLKRAWTYRNSMLWFLKLFTNQIDEHRSEVDPELAHVADRLRERLSGDTLDDAVFTTMSRIPLRWMKSKGPQGFPFAIQEFLIQVEQAA